MTEDDQLPFDTPDLTARLAIFETLVERTAPTPDDFRCRCDRCTYARGRRRKQAA